MAQNIYDQAGFFQAYAGLQRSVEGLAGAPEWPSLRAMLPELSGLRILDLGCGMGWFCRWAHSQGAGAVTGLDLSEKMLAEARGRTGSAAIRYALADLEEWAGEPASVDLVYSSLAFHYVEDAGRLFAAIYHALSPGGHLVFSTEHPIFMAAPVQAWSIASDGSRTWPVSGYADEGVRVSHWLGADVVKYHRTFATTVNPLLAAGFRIRRIDEFCPGPAQVATEPHLAPERERPMFLLIAAQR